MIIGYAIARGLSGYVQAQLYGIGSADVLTITACAVATSAVAALAALAPTLRATSLTPLAAIRP